MEDKLDLTFSSDDDDKNICNLMVSRIDPDGVTDILYDVSGYNARTLYEILTYTFPGRSR